MIIERERIVLMYSPRRASEVRAAEREARREIEAARTLGEVASTSAPFFSNDADRWYESCFATTELELVEQVNAAVGRYRATPWWRRTERRMALAAYIRANARLTVAHGLETVWR